jgi:hypothetical protein
MVLLFLYLEFDDLDSLKKEREFSVVVEDNYMTSDNSSLVFNDFDSFPKTLYKDTILKNEKYSSEVRHPEWLYLIKAFRHEFYLYSLSKEFDQVFIYLFMADIEDEFSLLKKSVVDQNYMRYDFFFFYRFNIIYPIFRFFYNILPHFIINFIYNFKNPTLSFYTTFFNFFYIILIFKEFVKVIFFLIKKNIFIFFFLSIIFIIFKFYILF